MPATYTIHIEAPVDKVFDFWKDPGKQMSVMPTGSTMTEVKKTEEGVGTYYSWSMRLFGLPVTGFDVFTEFVPNQRITDRSSFDLAGTWTATFEPEGSGTRFTLQRHPESVWVLRPLDRLMDLFRASMTRPTLEKVKAELERPTAQASGPTAPAPVAG